MFFYQNHFIIECMSENASFVQNLENKTSGFCFLVDDNQNPIDFQYSSFKMLVFGQISEKSCKFCISELKFYNQFTVIGIKQKISRNQIYIVKALIRKQISNNFIFFQSLISTILLLILFLLIIFKYHSVSFQGLLYFSFQFSVELLVFATTRSFKGQYFTKDKSHIRFFPKPQLFGRFIIFKIMKKLQLTFNNKYKTQHRIGLTQKSEIYQGLQLKTENNVAIKLQPLNQLPTSELELQAKIYRLLKGGVGIPNLYWYGVQNKYRVLVTQVFGPSLEQLLRYCDGKFSLKTVLLITDQILSRIEWLHSKQIVYNDIDANNFLVGLGQKADKIYIVDFGNARKFVDTEGNHFFFGNQTRPILNNLRFRSVHGHINKKTSRRDDLQSFGYMLVYLLKGSLPWDEIDESQQDRIIKIKQLKSSIPLSTLCSQLPIEFEKYFKYVKSLEYEQEPDYIWLKRLFKDLFENKGYVDNKVMDWAQKHKY